MATIKIHIIKGVNTYSENLLTKKHENVNKRKEVNFDVSDLGNYDRYNNRSKSFAVYKPKENSNITDKRSKSVNIAPTEVKDHKKHKHSKKDKKRSNSATLIANLFRRKSQSVSILENKEDKDEIKENKESNENKEGIEEDKFSQDNENDQNNNLENENNNTAEYNYNYNNNINNNNEDIEEQQQDNNDNIDNQEANFDGFDNFGNELDNDGFIDNVNPNDIEGFNGSDNDFGDYKFSSNIIPDPEPEQEPVKNDMAYKFQNFKNKVKEAFDPKEFKEKHDKNMDKMRNQMNLILEKLSKKKEEPESRDNNNRNEGDGENYWESGNNMNHYDDDINGNENIFKPKRKGKKFGNYKIKKKDRINLKIDGDFDSDNDDKKRCCC